MIKHKEAGKKLFKNAALANISLSHNVVGKRRKELDQSRSDGARPTNAGDGTLFVRASGTILYLRKGTSLRNPMKTSSCTEYLRISI